MMSQCAFRCAISVRRGRLHLSWPLSGGIEQPTPSTASSCVPRGRVSRCVATHAQHRYWQEDHPASGGRRSVPHDGAGTGGNTRARVTSGKYFTRTHEWFQVERQGEGVVGITQVAQRALGEVVFVRLPREGERFRVMDTLVTIEGLKTCGEVKSPVAGEVLEVNPRLEREPALVTHSPLADGWLVRMGFRRLPQYLRGSRTISRLEIEPLLVDPEGLQDFLRTRMGDAATPAREDVDSSDGPKKELVFDGLRSDERFRLHEAADRLQLKTQSRGRGSYRQLVVSRPRAHDAQEEDDASED